VGPQGWSSRDKFAAVLETATLNEADPAEYCRKRGLYPAQITAWRLACEQANDWDRASTARLGQAITCTAPSASSRQVRAMLAMITQRWQTMPCFMQMRAHETYNAGQAKPATGNPPDPSG
jgi:hypothetical protein